MVHLAEFQRAFVLITMDKSTNDPHIPFFKPTVQWIFTISRSVFCCICRGLERIRQCSNSDILFRWHRIRWLGKNRTDRMKGCYASTYNAQRNTYMQNKVYLNSSPIHIKYITVNAGNSIGRCFFKLRC